MDDALLVCRTSNNAKFRYGSATLTRDIALGASCIELKVLSVGFCHETLQTARIAITSN